MSTRTIWHQAVVDLNFVKIVAHFVDLDALADKIVAAHGGWDADFDKENE